MSSPSPAAATISPASLPGMNELDTFTKLFLLLIFLSLFIRICFAYIYMRRDEDLDPSTSMHHHSSDDGDQKKSITGLPVYIINSYQTFRYSRTNVSTIHVHDTTCSICISDYKETEILRMMPQCHHYFHRCCVDAWLKVNASCPICRNSLLKGQNNEATVYEGV